MKIALGCDHRGRRAVDELLPFLRSLGHEAIEMGPVDQEPCDYPDRAWLVANAVAMIQCVNLKIPSPQFHLKYKTAFKRESISMFNAALAVGI